MCSTQLLDGGYNFQKCNLYHKIISFGEGGGVLINFAMFEILKYKDNYINIGKNSLIVYIQKEAPKQ